MSLTINIIYKGKNGSAKAFALEMISSGIVGQIREEDGNLGYDYYFPLEDNESVLLIDSWVNQEALDRHHASPLMKQIAALREKYDLHMVVKKYSSIEDERDERFIRK